MDASAGNEFSIRRELREEAVVVILCGDVDATRFEEVRYALREAAAQGRALVVVDLGQVRYIESLGLGALISGLHSAKSAGCRFRLACPQRFIFRLLQLTQIVQVVETYPDLASALGELEEPNPLAHIGSSAKN
ncbi:MAG: STAS domain-containing protein [Armatimonadetes bacterium]|nr:STAS domain-containing protein [Armatimonadota bacterium]